MTGGADLDLGGCGPHRILRRMQRVTARAGYVARRMRARCPVVGRVRLMAGETLRVLLESGCERFGAEVDHARERSAPRLHVRAARPVTGLALQTAVAERPARITGLRMFGTEDAGDRRIVMAAQAGVRPLRAVRGIGMRRSRGGSRCGGRGRRCRDRGRCIGRERVPTRTQQQSTCGGHASTRQPPHSVRRGGNIVHDPHIRDSARAMAHSAGLHGRRIGAENRPAFRVLRDRG